MAKNKCSLCSGAFKVFAPENCPACGGGGASARVAFIRPKATPGKGGAAKRLPPEVLANARSSEVEHAFA